MGAAPPASRKPLSGRMKTMLLKYEIDEGKDLIARYRIWLQDGELTAEKAVALSNDFVDLPQTSVK
jgi:hypothetical protein